MKKYKNNTGLTLIEITIVLSLLLLVVLVAFSNFDFGVNLFSKGSVKSQMQFDSRMISDKVSESVRFSKNLSFANAYGGTDCIQSSNMNIVLPSIDDSRFDYSITFKTTNDPKLVSFTIVVYHTQSSQTFDLTTEVGLLNSIVNPTLYPPNTNYNVAIFSNP